MTLSLPRIATLVWLLAFICSFTWLPQFSTEFVIGSISCLVIAMALSDGAGIGRREWPLPRSAVLMAGGLFWLVTIVSMMASDILFVSWLYFFTFSTLPLTILFFLTGHDPQTRLYYAWLGVRVVLGGLAIAAIYQYFFMPQLLFEGGRVRYPLKDPNGLAAVFSLGVFLLSGQMLKRDGRINPADAVLLLLLVAAFFTAGSRGAMLAMSIMALIMVLIVGVRRIGLRNWAVFASIGAIAFVGIGMIYTPIYFAGPRNLFYYSYYMGLEKIFGERGLIWASTLKLIAERPWLGSGPGTFQFYYPEVRDPADMTVGYTVHNDPLQFGAESGIMATILFYGVCLLAGIRTLKCLRILSPTDDRRLDIIAPIFGLGAMVLHSHLTFNFRVLPCLMLAGFCFSVWYYHTAQVLNERFVLIHASRFLNKDGLEALFLIIACLVMISIGGPLYSQVLVDKADRDLKQGHFEAYASKINLADTLSLGMNTQAYVSAAMIPLGILEQTQKPLTEEERKEFLHKADDILSRGARTSPREPDLMIQQAKLNEIENRPAEAEKILRHALKVDPYHIPSRMALGDLLKKTGKLKEAVAVMREGLDWKYGPVRAMQYMEYFLQTMALQEELDQATGKSPKVP